MSFKFFRGNSIDLVDLGPLQLASLRVEGGVHNNNEYCFQFDDDEPFVFANGNNDLTISLRPTDGGNVEFNHNGRRFKIFARERQ
jgi:hypothetical protein